MERHYISSSVQSVGGSFIQRSISCRSMFVVIDFSHLESIITPR